MRIYLPGFLLLCAAAVVAAEPSALSLAAHFSRRSGECAKRVSLEQYQSLPLPVKTAEGPRYRIMFYSSKGANPAARQQEVLAPTTVAQFGLAGEKAECGPASSLPKSKRGEGLGVQVSPDMFKMTRKAFVESEAKLYAAIERAAKSFFKGNADKAAAEEFRKLFEIHAEPGLLAHYKALAPDFFAWVAASEK